MAAEPEFGPVPQDIIRPPAAAFEATQSRIEKKRSARRYLGLLNAASQTTKYRPYTWGFYVFRTAYGPGSDERFALTLKKFNTWVEYSINSELIQSKRSGGHRDPLPNQELIRRFQNDVVEDKEKLENASIDQIRKIFNEIVLSREGPEEAIQPESGDQNIEEENPIYEKAVPICNPRNQICLIVNEVVMASFDKYPEFPNDSFHPPVPMWSPDNCNRAFFDVLERDPDKLKRDRYEWARLNYEGSFRVGLDVIFHAYFIRAESAKLPVYRDHHDPDVYWHGEDEPDL